MNVLAMPQPRTVWTKRAAQGAVVVLAGAFALHVGFAPDLSSAARAALLCFAAAILGWTLTRADPAYVALATVLAMILSGAAAPLGWTTALGADIVWLLIAVFVVGAALEQSGLAARLRDATLAGARTTDALFWRMSLLLGVLAFLIPSTSGRAALAAPAMKVFFTAPGERAQRRAFAVLIPVVILVTTSAALTGAGSHILANDILREHSGAGISYAQWAVWGVPFALAAGAASCFVVARLFLTQAERRARVDVHVEQTPLRPAEAKVCAVAAALIAIWSTAGWHGLGIAPAALCAAALLMAPGIGVVSVGAGARAVNWRIILFVVAALAMGGALIESGAAQWLVERAWSLFATTANPLSAIVAITLITTGAHLFIASHVARAAILTPPVLIAAENAGLDQAAALFLAMAGVNYCLTLPVSSKALLIFEDGKSGLRTQDLVRLSAVIAPLYIALMLAFALVWWR